MHTLLWGGPLDGIELNTEDPPKPELVVGQFPGWPPYASDMPEVIRHHYVFDNASHRYNYAGDWPR